MTARNGGGAVLKAEALTKSYGRRVVVQHVDLEHPDGRGGGPAGPERRGQDHDLLHGGGPGAARQRAACSSATTTSPALPMYHAGPRRASGYLPQEASVFRKLTAEQNVLAILETLGMPPAGAPLADARAARRARASGPWPGQPAYTLSGGERRRLEICRALATSTRRFILLDEPFAGIDPIAVIDIQKIIAHLQRPRDRRPDHRPQRARDLENHGSGLYSQGRRGLPFRHARRARLRRGGPQGLPRREPSGWTSRGRALETIESDRSGRRGPESIGHPTEAGPSAPASPRG